ncbi:response regulator transcription factor [Erythrobacter sp. F6033]|uniref:response regulator n=1 Tax=Erythrobacter sp. F6033 TaxID=2926401 RepID=UPI001FF368A0|nr:response regulator transcription factor [Erythrobacter sp. F6033]MCK0129248.1 response regulator transcription factor [Erythrobacter sp. F6033]
MISVAIVEDDPVLRAVLADNINASRDMRVVAQAANVAEATPLIAAGGYDVMLCDLGLPDGSGVDVIRKEVACGRDTDILVITVFASQNKVLSAIQAGARGYLLKDERIEECLDSIRNIREGGSPISPIIARQLLGQIRQAPSQSEDVQEGGNQHSQDHATDAHSAPQLSAREYEVLNMFARGFSNAECAEILNISANTVATHIKNIYRKLEVNSRAEALFEASSHGLLSR